MKVLFLTNEYPPNVYGGAGVHVDYLSRELAKLMDVEVRAFGEQDLLRDRLKVTGFGLDAGDFRCPKALNSVFGAVRRCVDFNTAGIDADVVHCHTWYTHSSRCGRGSASSSAAVMIFRAGWRRQRSKWRTR